jgi:hypothetical protein
MYLLHNQQVVGIRDRSWGRVVRAVTVYEMCRKLAGGLEDIGREQQQISKVYINK